MCIEMAADFHKFIPDHAGVLERNVTINIKIILKWQPDPQSLSNISKLHYRRYTPATLQDLVLSIS